MKKGFFIIALFVASVFQLQAATCFSISGNGADQVTVSVTPDTDYSGAPQFFWVNGLVTISWPMSEGAGFIQSLSNLNGFSWSADGAPTLDGGLYYQKYQFATQNNVMLTSGMETGLFSLMVTAPSGSIDVTVAETPPAAVINGNASFSNVLFDQFANGGCILTTNLNGAPAPVELVAFDVKKKGTDNANISWTTASEINTSHFQVERSLDGEYWEAAGIVTAAGNSFETKNYTLEDNNLKRYIASDQFIYYRLKSVDYDDTFDYSGVKNIEVKFQGVAIQVYPNPTTEGIYVTVNMPDRNDELTAFVKDIHGRTLDVINLGNDKLINEYVNLNQLSAGTYFISVQGNDRIYSTERIVITAK